MRTINNILLNFDEVAYPFYEWKREDNIQKWKKVPVIKVSKENLKEIWMYRIQLDKNQLPKEKKKNSVIIFTTRQDNIAIEFNQEGKELFRSHLTLKEDLNLCELACYMKEEKISYQKLEKIEQPKEMRRTIQDKKIIQTELKTLEASNNKEKLSYLYYEWFLENEEDPQRILKRCRQDLEKASDQKIHDLSLIIQKTYKEQQ